MGRVPAGHRAALLGVALLGLLTAGCSQPTPPDVSTSAAISPSAPSARVSTSPAASARASTSPAAPSPAAGSPATSCTDDQPGRYTTELFDAAPVDTVSYAPGLLADVYAPADDPAACKIGVAWVHGGGFTQFDRTGDAEREWGNALARRGFVAASIDYRLGGGAPFALDGATDPERNAVVENAIADAQSAVDWLRGSGTEWGVDPARVAIGGSSAGAMTALGAALTATDPPCAVISVSGDLRPEWVAAQPVPVLFIHGNADDVVPYSSSAAGVAVLQSAGGTAELVTIDGAGHEITGPPRPEMVDAAARWLAQSCG
ncbi:prolyl oligopeptidase family serine peptidase [Nakamurella sp. GG22]